jgi:hypothetical protein
MRSSLPLQYFSADESTHGTDVIAGLEVVQSILLPNCVARGCREDTSNVQLPKAAADSHSTLSAVPSAHHYPLHIAASGYGVQNAACQ